MDLRNMICMMIVAGSALFTASARAQEIPVATGTDDTYCGGAAFDGTNYLVAILGDSTHPLSVTAQRVSHSGVTGPRISLGSTGGVPRVAFDGTNYLLIWIDEFFSPFTNGETDSTGTIYGQFINTSGGLVGPAFTVGTGANLKYNVGYGEIAFHDTTYFVTFTVGGGTTALLYGQRIGKSGTLLGGPVQISTAFAREAAIAFDGTNYLVVWNNSVNVYGQFVSESGSLVGSNFVIDQGSTYAGSPICVAFDGTRYAVAFHEFVGPSSIYGIVQWTLYARFVSTSGTAISNRVTICGSATHPFLPMAAFDGTNYLFTWVSMTNLQVQGRFFNTAGDPVGSEFTVFDPAPGKIPVGGVAFFAENQFVAGVSRMNTSYADGDIYCAMIPSSTTGIGDGAGKGAPREFSLMQNYPNPFNPETAISYQLSAGSVVRLRVYDLLGRQVAMLVDGYQQPGRYTARFRAEGLASGVYLYRLDAGSFVQTRKLSLVR